MADLHPNCVRIDAILAAAGLPGRVRILAEPAPTAVAAARQLGVPVGAIANSLVFTTAEQTPLLVLTSGAHRVDTDKVAALVGTASLSRATAAFVRDATGQPIGGVAPVGHPAPIPTLLDTALAEFPEIWAAGGIPHAVFAIGYSDLLALTSASEVAVAESAGMAQPTGAGDRAPTVVLVDIPRSALRSRLAEAMGIYVTAMGYPASSGPQRGTHMLRHAAFDSFRCRAALDAEGRMLGFGYGYTSMPGQWWHDLVLRAIPAAGARDWLGYAFELSELHVVPAAQGAGLGERLLRSLADGLPHRTMVLSTPEGENRAWRLYRRLGFEDLARNHLFPGDYRPFGVLGARLPFPPAPDRTAIGPRHPALG